MLKTVFRLTAFVLVVIAIAVVVRTVILHEDDQVSRTQISLGAEIDGDVIAGQLSKAIAIETVSDDDPTSATSSQFEEFAVFLQQSYPLVHKKMHLWRFPGGSLLYRWEGRSKGKAGVFLAHIDTVPVSSEEIGAWTHPPYAGTVADGFVWGRGALDDKGGLVALMEATELLLRKGFQPERTLYFAFGHDEELEGRGAQTMADEIKRLEPHGVEFVLDEGGFVTTGAIPGIDRPIAVVGIAEQGYLSLKLKVQETAGHSSAPTYPTTIGRFSRAIARLEADPRPMRIDGAAEIMFMHLAQAMSFHQRILFANLWLFEPVVATALKEEPQLAAMMRTTLAPTIIKGGARDNVIPLEATANVNLRLLPGDSIEEVEKWVRDTIDDEKVEIEAVIGQSHEASVVTDLNSEAFLLLESTAKRLEPLRAEGVIVAPYLVLGATDSRHYRELTTVVLRFIPFNVSSEQLGGFHGIDERVSIDSLRLAVGFYSSLMMQL